MHWSSEEQIDLFIANKRQLSNLGFLETHCCIFRENAFKIQVELIKKFVMKKRSARF